MDESEISPQKHDAKQPANKYVYYKMSGEYVGKSDRYNTDNSWVYMLIKNDIKNPNWSNQPKELIYQGSYRAFLKMAALSYCESGYAEIAMAAIAFCVVNHHTQLIHSGHPKYKEKWHLANTLSKLSLYSDESYAKANPAFREFLGINLDEATKASASWEKNEVVRNDNPKILTAFGKTISALRFYNGLSPITDASNGSIGWHGLDILNPNGKYYEVWQKNLCIKPEHKTVRL